MNPGAPSPDPVPSLSAAPVPFASTPEPGASGAEAGAPVVPPSPLTPEEQMALFEKELKETDWGHQPC
ncbi:MAG: hypothetical protein JNN01_09320 [Opitutaceae bacterium]|nr:hypothetical protein [Opitutaceae bacterium]